MDISTLSKRQLAGIAVVLFLLVVLPLIIYLVRQTQIFKPKAVGTGSRIEVYSGNTEVSGGTATSQNVNVKLIYEPIEVTGPNTVTFMFYPPDTGISINVRLFGNGVDRSITLSYGMTSLNNVPDGTFTVTLSNIPPQYVVNSILVNHAFTRGNVTTFSVTVPTVPSGVYNGQTIPSNTAIGINLSQSGGSSGSGAAGILNNSGSTNSNTSGNNVPANGGVNTSQGNSGSTTGSNSSSGGSGTPTSTPIPSCKNSGQTCNPSGLECCTGLYCRFAPSGLSGSYKCQSSP